jgi:ABC-type lipoprotein release transport system permease subunit
MDNLMNASTTRKVQRQRKLPLSKAIEIAYKQIRMRLSRSLLVTSGIVLAIAFLIAIQINDSLADGMRQWIATFGTSPHAIELRSQRDAAERAALDDKLALRDKAVSAASKDAQPFDATKLTGGATLEELKTEVGELPTDVATIQNGLNADPVYRELFSKWLGEARRAASIREQLSAPRSLESKLADNGVPTRIDDIAASKLQTRWLLGLALLVAFVGILNAMLMSVTERFREIGTMKCLGALDGFIVKLFLIESLFQGIVGTIVGLIVGVLVSLLMNWATYGNLAFKELQADAMLIAIGMSSLVGVVLTIAGAVWPAWQAARMHPIEAMRVEA